MYLLKNVAANSMYNKMDARNLGIVFEPSLLRKKTVDKTVVRSMAELATMATTTPFIEEVIQYYQQIFDNPPL